MQESLLKKVSDKDCVSREMTVIERLEFRRSNLIQELSRIEAAINELKYKDLSNNTVRTLTQIG